MLRTNPKEPKVPNPQQPEITFSPDEIAEREQWYDKLAPAKKFGPVVSAAFVAHQYAGNPGPQMAKFSVRGLGAPCPGVGGMIYCVPFAATFVDDQPRFVLSAHWGKKKRRSAASGIEARGAEEYEETLASMVRRQGRASDLFAGENMLGQNMRGFDSLYLGPSGNFYLLPPHTHDLFAGNVIRQVHPQRLLLNSGYRLTFQVLSGIQRVQAYNDGLGLTVDMNNPPNQRQLDAIREAWMRTSMERFVAEIRVDGKIVKHITSFGELVQFVKHYGEDGKDIRAVMLGS